MDNDRSGTYNDEMGGYVYLNQHTLAAIKELVHAMHESLPWDNLNLLPLWIPDIEKLLDSIESLLDRARFYACEQDKKAIQDDDSPF